MVSESFTPGDAGAVIVAAGSGARMGGADKIMAPLGGRPVLSRVVSVFEACPAVGRIVVVLSAAALERGAALAAGSGWAKVAAVVPGGARRQDSVAAGLAALGGCEWVIIHDGARPLLRGDLITGGLRAAAATGAAAAAIPVADTVKLTDADRVVRATLPRENLWAVQTPQVFRREIIEAAYRQAGAEATDDAALVERLGCRVKLYPGAYDNIKITTPFDLVLAEVLLERYGS